MHSSPRALSFRVALVMYLLHSTLMTREVTPRRSTKLRAAALVHLQAKVASVFVALRPCL